MSLLVVRWLHLVAAATWLGGLVVLAVLMVVLSRAGVDRGTLRASARAFGRVSWAAMATAVITGVLQVELTGLSWTLPALHAKLTLVGLVALLAAIHQVTARRSSDRVRRVVQALLVLGSLGIFAAAIAL